MSELTHLAGNALPSNAIEVNQNSQSSWFELLAEAWGKTLDDQANRISELSIGLGDGLENPSQVNELQAEALRMGFLSNASHTSMTSVGTALETMARKT